MKVREIMTSEVLTFTADTPLKDVAAQLVAKGISGAPVCDAKGHVVGVISEGDILYKARAQERRRGRLARMVEGAGNGPAAKSRARTAGEAMTSPPIVISTYRSVAEAARLMVDHQINRLPVVRDGQVVGIVTRNDVVRAFARTDEEIVREIRDDVLDRTMWLDPIAVKVDVDGGAVRLGGRLPTRSEAQLLERLVERVPGVVSVESSVTWSIDDTRAARAAVERTRP